MAEHGKKFIVRHAGVGPHQQGEVVDGSAFVTRDPQGKETDHSQRLLARGAIREATPAEAAGPTSVPVTAEALALSPAASAFLQEKDAEIERLRRFVGDQADKLASYERLGVAAPVAGAGAADDQLRRLAEQKDHEIERLKAASEANEEKLKAAEHEAAERSKEGDEQAKRERQILQKAAGAPSTQEGEHRAGPKPQPQPRPAPK